MAADDMYPPTLDGLLVELDGRGRASLTRLARHRRYLAKVHPDGTIVLTPAQVVPANEMRHLDHRAALAEALDVKVAFCNWCPDPANPSPEFHPDGQPEHVEDAPDQVRVASRPALDPLDALRNMAGGS